MLFYENQTKNILFKFSGNKLLLKENRGIIQRVYTLQTNHSYVPTEDLKRSISYVLYAHKVYGYCMK